MNEGTKRQDRKNPQQPSGPGDGKSSSAPRRSQKSTELLAGILDEVQYDATREENRLQASLAKKREEERLRVEQDAENRRRKGAEALAAEAERQRRAEAVRTDIYRTMTAPTMEAVKEPAPQVSGDYASTVAPRKLEMSADHRKVPKKQKILPIVLLGLVFLIVAGVGGFLIITLTAPTLDAQQYPKVAVNLVTVNPPSTQLTFAMIPEPEPVVDPALEQAEQTETAQNTRDRNRNRDRDRDRNRDDDPQQTNGTNRPTLDIDLDGSSVFDRGSE